MSDVSTRLVVSTKAVASKLGLSVGAANTGAGAVDSDGSFNAVATLLEFRKRPKVFETSGLPVLNDLIIFTILYWIGRFYCRLIESFFKVKINLRKGGYMVVGMIGIPLALFITLFFFLNYKFFTDWITS